MQCFDGSIADADLVHSACVVGVLVGYTVLRQFPASLSMTLGGDSFDVPWLYCVGIHATLAYQSRSPC